MTGHWMVKKKCTKNKCPELGKARPTKAYQIKQLINKLF
jgi:hypothetical protein